MSVTKNELNHPIKDELIKARNAMTCKGCGNGMHLLKTAMYCCEYCGGVSTQFGGFWSYKMMNYSKT